MLMLMIAFIWEDCKENLARGGSFLLALFGWSSCPCCRKAQDVWTLIGDRGGGFDEGLADLRTEAGGGDTLLTREHDAAAQ